MNLHKQVIFFTVVLLGLFSLLLMGLGPALIGGFATYLLISSIYHLLSNNKYKNLNEKLKINISVLSSVVLMIILSGLIFKSLHSIIFYNKIGPMLTSIVDIIGQVKMILSQKFPSVSISISNEEELKQFLINYIQKYSGQLIHFGNSIFHFLLIIFLGMIIGSIYTYSELNKKYILNQININEGSNHYYLIKYISSFSEKFKLILYSQFWVAIVNTVASFLYLAVILPLFGIDIPYKTIAIVITFVASLIPIIGNLISNTLITILSLSAGIKVAIASLVYLIVIHKFEYLVIAKVIGEKVKSSIWEILCAIIIFEIIFGLAGMVLAPVIYAYIKDELKNLNFFGKN